MIFSDLQLKAYILALESMIREREQEIKNLQFMLNVFEGKYEEK